MAHEKEIVDRAFISLSDTEKIVILRMGMEFFYRCSAIHIAGHSTLSGHCYYLNEGSNDMTEILLCHLNGSKMAESKFHDFMSSDLAIGLVYKIMAAKYEQ
jgi:hypothetical protein